ncbi:hypothetical protein FS837_012269 [Tulasnella sp. UAMH 9824]|nr:hypothetical protein FS837_012269 [Tulasnella sp. UAMH 9824]
MSLRILCSHADSDDSDDSRFLGTTVDPSARSGPQQRSSRSARPQNTPPQSVASQIGSEFLCSDSGGSTAASVPPSSSANKDNVDVVSRSEGWPSSLEKKDVTLSILPAPPPDKSSSCLGGGRVIGANPYDERLAKA